MNKTSYITKFPLSGYIGVIAYLFVILVFSYNIIFEEMPFLGGIGFSLLSIVLIDTIYCGKAGKIIVVGNDLTIKYFFPWRHEIKIKLKSLINISTISTHSRRLYSKVYIETDSNKFHFDIQSNYGFLKDIYDFESFIENNYIKKS